MSDEIISFQIQRALSAGGPFTTVDTKVGAARTDLDPGLPLGEYFYRIRARNISGFGPWSNVASVKILADPIPALSPWFYLKDDEAGSTPGQWDDISGNGRHWTTAPSCNFPTLTASGFDFAKPEVTWSDCFAYFDFESGAERDNSTGNSSFDLSSGASAGGGTLFRVGAKALYSPSATGDFGSVGGAWSGLDNGSPTYTFFASFYPTNNSAGESQFIFKIGSSLTFANTWFSVYIDASNNISSTWTDEVVSHGVSPTFNAWNTIALEVDFATKTHRVWLNDAYIGQGVGTKANPPVPTGIQIGCYHLTWPNLYLRGYMDAVSCWNGSLTDAGRTFLHNGNLARAYQATPNYTAIVGPDLTGLNGGSTARTMLIYCQRKSTDDAGPWNFGDNSSNDFVPFYLDGTTWYETFSRPNRGAAITMASTGGWPTTKGHTLVFRGGNISGSQMGCGAEGIYTYTSGNTENFPSDPIIGHNNSPLGLVSSLGADMYVRAVAFFDYELTEAQFVECADYLHQLYGTINFYYISQMLEVSASSPMYDPGTFHGVNPGGTIAGGTRTVLNGINMVESGSYLWSGTEEAAFTKDFWNGSILCAHNSLLDDGMLYIISDLGGNNISFGFRKVAVTGGVQHQWITGTYASYQTFDIGPVVTNTDELHQLGFTLDFSASTHGTLRLYFDGALDSTQDLPSAAGGGLTLTQLLGMRSKAGETPDSRVGQIFIGINTAVWPDWMMEAMWNDGDGRPDNDDPWY